MFFFWKTEFFYIFDFFGFEKGGWFKVYIIRGGSMIAMDIHTLFSI